jgi:hemoglobin
VRLQVGGDADDGPLPRASYAGACALPIGAGHFDRWVALFAATAHDVCPTSAAEHFIGKAGMIAESLELGVATHRRLIRAKGERLPAARSV